MKELDVDVRKIAEQAASGSMHSSAQEVVVALEMVELSQSELHRAQEGLDQAIQNFEQERILCFLSTITAAKRSWCSLHGYFQDDSRSGYYSCRHGGLVEGVVETNLLLVVKDCYHRGDHYGSDREWQEEHLHLVCPQCFEQARDEVGTWDLAQVRRVEKRLDGYYYKNGRSWVKIDEDAKFFLAPQALKPEWEEEFQIPPSLKPR